ncbi:MAG: hypothetical protein FWH36_07420, partial [Lentimicrobiaceae bacterium]|nr:hypothetical protein [Lentimicrobiaceae bacterium]
PLHGNWNTPIKLTPTADPSKPGGEWSVVGVNDWFLNNYNQGAGSAFFSNTPLILGHYTNTFTDYHTIEGLDISALNIDTLNNNYYTIKASNDKVGDPNLRIVPKNFFNRQLNIGNKPSGSIASDGRLYINRDMLNICMQLIDVRPPPPPQLSSPEYCFAAKDMIICYNNTNDAELIYDLGAAGYINRVGINPATNVNILDESLIPVGKSVYTPPVQQSIYNGVQKSAGGVRKVVWR